MQLHLIIHGKVQGVFYRAETKDVACSLGLTGWVRNRPDGSVEVLAQGQKEKLDQILAWCKKGPSTARVERVEEEWSEGDELLKRFDIV